MFVRIGMYPKRRSHRPRQEFVRIHKYDPWNLDTTLAKIIVLALAKFKENLHGHPMTIGSMMEEWIAILDRMRRVFDMLNSDYERSIIANTIGKDPNFEDLQFTDELSQDLWVEYKRQMDAAYKEIQEGLYLLAKYYRNLWG